MITLTQTDWTTVKLVSNGEKHEAQPLSLTQLQAFLERHELIVEGKKGGVYRRKRK